MSPQPGKTVLEVIHATTAFFQQGGVESPRLNIELMLAHVLQKKRLQLYLDFERTLDEPTLEILRGMVKRRVAGEPLQYILGKTEFHGLEFAVDDRALIPRPETELLVEHVIAECKERDRLHLLDLGTGSGCIAVTLAKNLPDTTIMASDQSKRALELAQTNAARHGVADRIEFTESDLFASLGGRKFDWIVSNPPYVAESDAPTLAREVRDHEPRQALFAGPDGLGVIRRIIGEASAFLTNPGHVALEIGAGQSREAQRLFKDAGYLIANIVQDYQGCERCIMARRDSV